MNRRDLILGGALLAAAGGAAALTPRNRLVLLGDQTLDDIIPDVIGDWSHVKSSGFILPKSPGSLADRLYSQTLTRLYESVARPPVMLVIAYGAVQNDLLQLHRPEVCYSAVGFTISDSRRAAVTLAGGVQLPVRELVASTDSRTEEICYWTRIGDDLPTDGREQRWVKLRQQMRGYLADGILVRMSTLGLPDASQFAELRRFAGDMIAAIQPANRAVLIGRPLAAETKA